MTTKGTAKSCSALTADTQVTCQNPSKQVPVPEPKRVSQPIHTHTHTCPVCVQVATGVSTVFFSCESHQFKALKAKDGTCRETEGKKKGTTLQENLDRIGS